MSLRQRDTAFLIAVAKRGEGGMGYYGGIKRPSLFIKNSNLLWGELIELKLFPGAGLYVSVRIVGWWVVLTFYSFFEVFFCLSKSHGLGWTFRS